MLFAEVNSSGEEYNVLRVEEGGRLIFQSPAALPIFRSETPSSQGSHRTSSSDSGSLSWHSIGEDLLEHLDLRQRRDSCPFSVRETFSCLLTNLWKKGPISLEISNRTKSNICSVTKIWKRSRRAAVFRIARLLSSSKTRRVSLQYFGKNL